MGQKSRRKFCQLVSKVLCREGGIFLIAFRKKRLCHFPVFVQRKGPLRIFLEPFLIIGFILLLDSKVENVDAAKVCIFFEYETLSSGGKNKGKIFPAINRVFLALLPILWLLPCRILRPLTRRGHNRQEESEIQDRLVFAFWNWLKEKCGYTSIYIFLLFRCSIVV